MVRHAPSYPDRPVLSNNVVAAVVDIITDDGGGGTGFVIEGHNGEHVVVTAAHVLVNQDGHARSAMVVAAGETREIRFGTHAAVHGGWYAMRWDANDVAFIILNESFSTVKALNYKQTPVTDDELASVYGFPVDTDAFTPRGQLCVSEEAPMTFRPSSLVVEHRGDTETGA